MGYPYGQKGLYDLKSNEYFVSRDVKSNARYIPPITSNIENIDNDIGEHIYVDDNEGEGINEVDGEVVSLHGVDGVMLW